MNRSETTGCLATALAKAQGQMGNALKDASNPYFKSRYAPLSAIVDAIKRPLSDNGIAYVQTMDTNEGSVTVETTLLHVSGEWLSSQLRMRPVKDDPQGIGSAITYARRYALQAIVGVAADDDDDGNAASGNIVKAEPAPRPQPAPKPPTKTAVSSQPAHDGRTIPDSFKDVKEMMTWGHDVTGLASKEMLNILGVENMLLIATKHGSLRNAAEVLLANVPQTEEVKAALEPA